MQASRNVRATDVRVAPSASSNRVFWNVHDACGAKTVNTSAELGVAKRSGNSAVLADQPGNGVGAQNWATGYDLGFPDRRTDTVGARPDTGPWLCDWSI